MFVPEIHFHPCKIFTFKTSSQPLELNPIRGSTMVSSGFVSKYETNTLAYTAQWIKTLPSLSHLQWRRKESLQPWHVVTMIFVTPRTLTNRLRVFQTSLVLSSTSRAFLEWSSRWGDENVLIIFLLHIDNDRSKSEREWLLLPAFSGLYNSGEEGQEPTQRMANGRQS